MSEAQEAVQQDDQLEQKEPQVDVAPQANADEEQNQDEAKDKTTDQIVQEPIPKPDQGELDVDLDEDAVPVESPPSTCRKMVWIVFPILLLIMVVMVVIILLHLRR